jgi:hypothetical protein
MIDNVGAPQEIGYQLVTLADASLLRGDALLSRCSEALQLFKD